MPNPVEKKPVKSELSKNILNACTNNGIKEDACRKSFEVAKKKANATGKDVSFYGERVSPEKNIPKRTRRTNLIPYAIIGLLLLILIPIGVSAATGKYEGYITLPSCYNDLSASSKNMFFTNNRTSADLDASDDIGVGIITNGSAQIQIGWNVNYVGKNAMDLVNATIIMNFYSNASFIMRMVCISENSSMAWHRSWINLSIVQGENTFDNLVLIGENGFVENISAAFDVFPLICLKNNMFLIEMNIPENIELSLDQIACKFYARNFALYLYNQFFDN